MIDIKPKHIHRYEVYKNGLVGVIKFNILGKWVFISNGCFTVDELDLISRWMKTFKPCECDGCKKHRSFM